MSEIRLPSLGAEMDEGTLLEWYVEPGDEIHYGDTIALLDTEKAEIEMEAYESGTIEALLIEPGQTIAVGEPIARLVSSGAGPAASPPPTSSPSASSERSESRSAASERPDVDRLDAAESKRAPAPKPPLEVRRNGDSDAGASDAEAAAPGAQAGRIKATPLARRLAAERGLDLSRLSGSGPHGAIVEADIPAAASSGPASRASAAATSAPTTARTSTATSAPRAARAGAPSASSRTERRREIIAAAMTRSKREIPHYYLSTSVEIEPAIDWLEDRNRERAASERLVLAALLIKAVALAAREFPELNGHWREGGFHASEGVHVGMVVSLRDGGLVIPTFANADERPLEETMGALRDVVGRARAGRLRSRELGEATITITSLGDDGVESIFGVIYPPQVAIVGFGGIHRALRAEGSLHGTQPVLRATLAADHRASDGQRGSRFLQSISQRLRNPEQL